MARVRMFQSQKMRNKLGCTNNEDNTMLKPKEQERQTISKTDDKRVPKLIINCSTLTSTIKQASSKSAASPNASDSGSKLSSDVEDTKDVFAISIADKVKTRKRGTRSAETSAHCSSKLKSDLVPQRRKLNLPIKQKTAFLTPAFSPVKDTETVSATLSLSSPSISDSEKLELSSSSSSTVASSSNAKPLSDSKVVAAIEYILFKYSVEDKSGYDSESQFLKSPHSQTDSNGLFPTPALDSFYEELNIDFAKWNEYFNNSPSSPKKHACEHTLNALDTTQALKLIPTTCNSRNEAEMKSSKPNHLYDANSPAIQLHNFDPDAFLNLDWITDKVAAKKSPLKVPHPRTLQASPGKGLDMFASELNVACFEEVTSEESVPFFLQDGKKLDPSDILESCQKLFVERDSDGIADSLDEVFKTEEVNHPSLACNNMAVSSSLPLSQASEKVKEHSRGVEENNQCIKRVSKKTNGLTTPAVQEDQNESRQCKTKRQRGSAPRESDRIRDMDNRHIVYVGDIPQGYTQDHLQERFQVFGTIKDIKLYHKECDADDICVAMNSNYSLGCSQIASLAPNKRMKVYAFITFTSLAEATAAIDHGNKGQSVKLNINFGARRHFVGSDYTDLDGNLAASEKRKFSFMSEEDDSESEDDYTSFLMLEQKKRGLSPLSGKRRCHS